jgi:DNA modification methylase
MRDARSQAVPGCGGTAEEVAQDDPRGQEEAVTERIICADVMAGLRELPDESIQCVVTSPPYWGLRDYGTARWEGGDPGCAHVQGRPGAGRADGNVDARFQRNRDGSGAFKRDCDCGAVRTDQQIGAEANVEEWVARLVDVFREVRRILRPDGTLWLNLGDSYASNPSSGGRQSELLTGGEHHRTPKRPGYRRPNGIKPKDLIGQPWRVVFVLQADGWWLRSEIIWHKPNPMPESVTDRPTKAHEQIFLLTKSATYYYDAEAVRERFSYGPPRNGAKPSGDYSEGSGRNDGSSHLSGGFQTGESGRNLRTVWTIATQPYPEAHFATFPPEIPKRCILAGTSAKGGCAECGAPWEREVETTTERTGEDRGGNYGGVAKTDGTKVMTGGYRPGSQYKRIEKGWRPTCDHAKAETVPQTVLDPFLGSGTTCAVAQSLGRDYLGIELNPAYVELARKRIAAETPGLALA